MASTLFTLINKSGQEVSVYLTLGTVEGCISSIKDIPFVQHYTQPRQGWFTLKDGHSVSYTPPEGMGFNGNYTFGTAPHNCPPDEFPTGVNLAEFMLNNSFQGPNAQETIDISAVPGVNAFLQFSMTDGGTWNAGSSQPDVTNFENKEIGKNAGLVGVFPYACTTCTSGEPVCPKHPPVGAPNPPIYQKEQICNVQRNAAQSGGTVLLTFKGFVPKP